MGRRGSQEAKEGHILSTFLSRLRPSSNCALETPKTGLK
jgi:hypothetical protein